MIFGQGKNIPLNQAGNNLPQLGEALNNWFQKMSFVKITKTVVNYQVVETSLVYNFEGVWQPASAQSLSMKPEGQRGWKWYTLHAKPALVLVPDEVIIYSGVKYRVRSKQDYTEYGYVQYELHEDFQGE